jgi:hypothetical protein
MARRRRQVSNRSGDKNSWQAVGGITAIVTVLVGIVFGIAELRKDPKAPVDTSLEVVDVEFAANPAEVTVLSEAVKGEQPAAPASTGAGTQPQPALVITMRNPADDPAVLTGLKLVVHETLLIPGCGPAQGGGIDTSLNYDFRFPTPLSQPWSHVNPQNFGVDPHGVDALSITMGPQRADEIVVTWRFSVYAVAKGGLQAHWADGIASNTPGNGDFSGYVRGDPSAPGYDEQAMRQCAARQVAQLDALAGRAGSKAVAEPGFTALRDAHREAAIS